MYDKGKVLTALFALLFLFSLPFLFSLGERKEPEIILPEKEKRCVEEKTFMRKNHMKFLSLLRDRAIREGKRSYISRDGRTFDISLTSTCLGCHKKKDEFCDRCHNYVGVKPDCFSCHIFEGGL